MIAMQGNKYIGIQPFCPFCPFHPKKIKCLLYPAQGIFFKGIIKEIFWLYRTIFLGTSARHPFPLNAIGSP